MTEQSDSGDKPSTVVETRKDEKHVEKFEMEMQNNQRRKSSVYKMGIEPEEEMDDWDDDPYADDDAKLGKLNVVAKLITAVQTLAMAMVAILKKWTRGYLLTAIFLIGFAVYFIIAMVYKFGDDGSLRLLVLTVLGVIIYTRAYLQRGGASVWRTLIGCLFGEGGPDPKVERGIRIALRVMMYCVVVGVIAWSIFENGGDMDSMMTLPGLAAFVVLCLVFSQHPKKINWHTIFWGLGLQFICAICTLRYSFGRTAIAYLADCLDEFFANSKAASHLIFGPVTKDHSLVFESLPILFMVSSMLSVLYYVGAMQMIIVVVGNVLSFIMDTEIIESTSVAAGIFLEGTNAVVALRPYLPYQSKSQLFLVLTSGFASLGGAYLAFLRAQQVSMEFILPAMLISAPATFAVCKMIFPETRPKDHPRNKMSTELQNLDGSGSIMDAFQTGAMIALPLIGTVISMAYAFVSVTEWVNQTFEWMGDRVGVSDLTLNSILSYVLYPVALAMGIRPKECMLAADLLGTRFINGNFIAFLKMLPFRFNREAYEEYMLETNFTGPIECQGSSIMLVDNNTLLEGGLITKRSEMVLTFSLCGFSSIMSMAFTIGVFYTLIPQRRQWLSRTALLALLAGNIANCMTGCFAGLFYKEGGMLDPPCP